MQVINTNIPSLNAQRNLGRTGDQLAVSLQRLSTGLRINSARDDAAGLAISDRMTAQIRGMDQARRNANDGVSLAQVGEGALGQMNDILQRIRELSVQSLNGTNSISDRVSINAEVSQLTAELDRFALTTDFNGQKLFDGSFSKAVLQIGANANEVLTATSSNLRTNNFGSYQIRNRIGYASVAVTGNMSGTVLSGANSGSVVSGTNSTTTASGVISINGGNGGATITSLNSGSTARDIAAAINATNTGVRATANNSANLQFQNYTQANVDASGRMAYSFNITGSNTNAVNVSFTIGNSRTAEGLAESIQAFNDRASQTGITARLNDTANGIILSNDDGSDIMLQAVTLTSGGTVALVTGGGQVALASAAFISASGSGGAAGGSTQTSGYVLRIGGQVSLDSNTSYSITALSGNTIMSGVFQSSGTTVGAMSAMALAAGSSFGSNLASVNSLDVTTTEGANQALRVVDSALATISSQRARFGALQNRFQATINNLQTSSENLAASRSRIQDADFAAETANLTRAQILQQAGTAMLAQANALPNQVLTLLRG